MRVLTAEEMALLVDSCKWATICTVSPEGRPYAVEATPYHDGEDTCFMINSRGGTWRSLQANPQVLLKYTLTNRSLSWWAGISGHGVGRFDPDPDAIRRGFDLLGMVMDTDYSKAGQHHSSQAERSPLLRVTIHKYTGRCSAGADEALFSARKPAEDDR